MYEAGWSKREITVNPQGYAMMGYGMWHNRAWGQATALYARALYLRDAGGHALIFVLLDLGYITHAMRDGVVRRLRPLLGDAAPASCPPSERRCRRRFRWAFCPCP